MAEAAVVEPAVALGDTGSGFLVGTEPAQPRTQVDWDGAAAPTGSPQTVIAQPPPAGTTVYTAEDIARARQEEKQKLYDRLEEQDKRLKQIEKEREEREEALRKEQEDAAAEAKRKEQEAMSAKQLVEATRAEFEQRFAEIEQQRQVERATFEKEREFTRLQDYQRDRIAQESEYIMPELRDLIGGSSEQEIDQAIERAKEKTQQIMGRTQQVQQISRQEMQGVSPTAPPVGPMEQQSTIETITPQDIATMDMETYKKHRGSLLAATSRAYGGR